MYFCHTALKKKTYSTSSVCNCCEDQGYKLKIRVRLSFSVRGLFSKVQTELPDTLIGGISVSTEKLTLFLQVNFTREEGESGWQASCGRVPRPALQERGSPPFRKPAMAPGGRGRLWVWGRGAPTTASIPGY